MRNDCVCGVEGRGWLPACTADLSPGRLLEMPIWEIQGSKYLIHPPAIISFTSILGKQMEI
jgi:hypothetical protein